MTDEKSPLFRFHCSLQLLASRRSCCYCCSKVVDLAHLWYRTQDCLLLPLSTTFDLFPICGCARQKQTRRLQANSPQEQQSIMESTRLHQTASAAVATADNNNGWPPLQKNYDTSGTHTRKNDDVAAAATVHVNLLDYIEGGSGKNDSPLSPKKPQYIFDPSSFPDATEATQKRLVAQIQASCDAEQPLKVHSWARHKEQSTRGTLRIRLRKLLYLSLFVCLFVVAHRAGNPSIACCLHFPCPSIFDLQ
jgi:hypothetical protein